MTDFDEDDEFFDPELDLLERLSNSVVDLIEQGHFDDAERACLELKRGYPEQMDWIFRTGQVHEARGEANEAVECYQQCLDFIERNPDGFDEESKDYYRSGIERLQPARTR